MLGEFFVQLNRLLLELDEAQRIMDDLQRRVAETRQVAGLDDVGPGSSAPVADFLRAYA